MSGGYSRKRPRDVRATSPPPPRTRPPSLLRIPPERGGERRLLRIDRGFKRVPPQSQKDFSGTYSDDYDGRKPTILFDLNGVLLQNRVFIEEKAKQGIPVHPRPGLRHLASLYPHFRVGLYTSARHGSVELRVRNIWEHLGSDPTVPAFIDAHSVPPRPGDLTLPGSLFSLVLDRQFCRPDPHWHTRDDGEPHDSMKPLDAHGFDPARTVLIDDSFTKIHPHEHANAVILPSYTVSADPELATEPHDALLPRHDPDGAEDPLHIPRQLPVLRALVALLLAHVAGTEGDVRPGLERVRADLDQALSTDEMPEALRHVELAPLRPGPHEVPLVFDNPPPQPPFGPPRTLPPRNAVASPRSSPPHRARALAKAH
eukprot:jgi/Ulvmu1/8432/UM043_0010.1